MVRTGPIVTLEVAKQGAIHHGLATLLSQPSPIMTRGKTLIMILILYIFYIKKYECIIIITNILIISLLLVICGQI